MKTYRFPLFADHITTTLVAVLRTLATRSRAKVLLALTGLAVVTATLTIASPASAGGISYLWSPSGSTPMYYAPNTQYSNVKVWDGNGTKFQMICWLDNAGHRWFYGQEFSHGYYGYITAGYVYNQVGVGHC